MSLRIRTTSAFLLMLLILCIDRADGRDPRLAEIKVPIFSADAFPRPHTGLLTQDFEVNKRPPFWPGEGVFKYTAVRAPGGGFAFGPTYYYRIEGITIEFSYAQSRDFFGVASGARILDEEKNLSAEAKVIRVIRPEGGFVEAIEIQEFHYSDSGSLIFTCRSRIETDSEWKVKEMDVIGEKEREYFPIWPILRH